MHGGGGGLHRNQTHFVRSSVIPSKECEAEFILLKSIMRQVNMYYTVDKCHSTLTLRGVELTYETALSFLCKP